MKEKESVCKFCGVTCTYNTATKRMYDLDGGLHVRKCPKRARHFHEKALGEAEERRQNQHGEYNRMGTESDYGDRLA